MQIQRPYVTRSWATANTTGPRHAVLGQLPKKIAVWTDRPLTWYINFIRYTAANNTSTVSCSDWPISPHADPPRLHSRDSPSVSTRQSAEVPGGLLRHWSSETALSTSSLAGRATSSTQYPRPSRIFCRRTNRLELASRWAERHHWRQLF